MKATLVIKGFIDPRRPDTVKLNFEIDDGVVERALSLKPPHFIQRKYYEHAISNIPFRGRETWIEINGKIFNRISGSGPAPSYPMTEGDIVNLEINF